MKKLFVIFMLAGAAMTGRAQVVDVQLPGAGTLWYYLAADGTPHDPRCEKEPVKILKIRGDINGDDIKLIRDLCGADWDWAKKGTAGTLEELDLSEARIVGGGESIMMSMRNPHVSVPSPETIKEYTLENVVSMGMFHNCSSLKRVKLPASATQVEAAIFGNTAVEMLDLPEGITAAYSPGGMIQTVYLPSTIQTVDDGLFANPQLSLLYCAAQEPPTVTGNAQAAEVRQRCRLMVPVGSKAKYAAAEVWKEFGNIEEYDTAVEAETVFTASGITYRLERGTDGMAAVVVSGSKELSGDLAIAEKVECNGRFYPVVKIEGEAFRGNGQITSLSLPEGLRAIGSNAFLGCENLSRVSLPETLTDLGTGAFARCYALAAIALPAGLTAIPKQAFYGSQNAERLDIPEGVAAIYSEAFFGAEAETIVLPATLTLVRNGFPMANARQIVCRAAVPPACEYPFSFRGGISIEQAHRPLYVPDESVELYQAAEEWCGFDVRPLSEWVETGVEQTAAETRAANIRAYRLDAQPATAGEKGVTIVTDGTVAKKVAGRSGGK